MVSFFGRPFAGKDFQAARFKDTYSNVAVLSAGGLLRDESLLHRSGLTQEQVVEINRRRNNGILVEDSVVARLLHTAIRDEIEKGNTTIFLTGNPRTRAQLKALREWEKEQKSKDTAITSVYIEFRLSKEQANSRRQKRLTEEQRADDVSDEAVAQRHEVYRRNVEPMLRTIRLRRILREQRLYTIDAGATADEVTARVTKILKPYLTEKRVSPEGQMRRKEG